MSSSPKLPIDDPELLARELLALREQVVDMQRQMARYGAGGEQRHIAGMEVSISEREELLLEAERIAHMGSWVWDVESGAVSWSDELFRILGYDLFRILGYDPTTDAPSIDAYFATVHPDDRERVSLASKRIAETGVAAQVFYRVLRKDGSVRHVQTHGAVLFDAAGKLRRIVGTILDITESHRAALELEHALHQLQDAQRFARLGAGTTTSPPIASAGLRRCSASSGCILTPRPRASASCSSYTPRTSRRCARTWSGSPCPGPARTPSPARRSTRASCARTARCGTCGCARGSSAASTAASRGGGAWSRTRPTRRCCSAGSPTPRRWRPSGAWPAAWRTRSTTA